MNILEKQEKIDRLSKTGKWRLELYKFINENVDLNELATNLGYKRKKDSDTKSKGTLAYEKDDVVVFVTKARKPGYIWRSNEFTWSDVQKSGPVGMMLFDKNYALSDSGKELALKDMVNYLKTTSGEYQTWEENMFRSLSKQNVEGKLKVKVSGVAKDPSNEIEREQRNAPKQNEEEKPVKIFEFEPVENIHPLLIDRGLKVETLNHPLFKGVFGESAHQRLGGGDSENGYFFPKHLVYDKHLRLAYRNDKGQVIAVEEKNTLTKEKYEQEYNAYLAGGESVRRNPSKFILDSAKDKSIWYPNLPENPNVLIIGEQPIDVISFFQLHKDDVNLENAAIFSTGGVLTGGQISFLKQYINEHKIQKVYTCFDKDIHGLNYALSLADKAAVRNIVEQKFTVQWVVNKHMNMLSYTIGKDGVDQYQNDKVLDAQTDLINLIKDKYQFEGADIFPSIVKSTNSLLTLDVPYTQQNAISLFALHEDLLGVKPKQFELSLPEKSKDWNDALNNVHNYSDEQSVYLVDSPANRNKLFMDINNNLVYQRRFYSYDITKKDFVGQYAPSKNNNAAFVLDKYFNALPADISEYSADLIKTGKFIQEALALINQEFTASVMGKGKFDRNYLVAAVTRGISFDAIKGEYTRKGEVKAKVDENNLIFIGEVGSQDKAVINAMELYRMEAANYNKAPFFFRESSRGIYLIDPDEKKANNGIRFFNNTIYQDIIHGTYINQGGINVFVPNKAVDLHEDLVKRRDEFVNKVLAGEVVEEGLAKRFEENDKRELIETLIIGTWNAQDKVIDLTADANLEDDSVEQVIERFQQYLIDGRNPNLTGYVGLVDENFNLSFMPGFDPEKHLDIKKQLQLQIVERSIENKRLAFQQLKQKYHEPFYPVNSENGLFKYDGVPHYKYDQQHHALIRLADSKVISNRVFHPYYYKALKLFVKNRGVFFKYINQVKVKKEGLKIYYKKPEFELGYIFLDKSVPGVKPKAMFALYKDCPQFIRDEIRMFSPYPEATKEILLANNLTNDKPVEAAEVKEKKVNQIPFEYTPFFDSRTGKFISVSDEVLSSFKNHQYMAYMEAYMWNLNNNGKQHVQAQAYSITRKGDDLYFGPLHCVRYDATNDKLIFLVEPGPKILPAIALEELELVKSAKNRVCQHALEITSKEEVNSLTPAIDKNKIKAFADKIAVGTKTGDLVIKDKDFTVQKLAIITEGTLQVDNRFKEYGPILGETLQYYANIKNLKLDWVSIEAPVKAQSETLNTGDEISRTRVYNHDLLLSNKVVFSSLVNLEMFKGSLQLDEHGGMNFLMRATKNEEKTVPFGHDWSKDNTPSIWITQTNLQHKNLVICESPEQALLHLQGIGSKPGKGNDAAGGILKNINENTIYISIMNFDNDKVKGMVEGFIKQDTNVEVIGNSLYKFSKEIKCNSFLPTIDYVKDELKIVANLQKQFSTYKPEPELQVVFDNVHKHNYLNPAAGLAVFPVSTNIAKSVSVYGTTFNSKQQDQLWFSRNPKDKDVKTVAIAPTIQEAMHYIAYDGKYTKNECVIALNGQVSDQQVERLHKMLANPKLDTKIFIINSDHLCEKLISKNFMLANYDRVINADPDVSFEEKVKKSIDLLRENDNVSSKFDKYVNTDSEKQLSTNLESTKPLKFKI